MVVCFEFENKTVQVRGEPSCLERTLSRRTHVRIHQIPAIFPRPDMKTDEIVWLVDISHLQAKRVSEEKEHQKNGTVNQ